MSVAPEALCANFATRFGGPPAGLLRAPGRVNLIGEHIDYNGFAVLPMAIDRDIAAAWRPRDDGCVVLASADGHPEREFALTPPIRPYERGDWGNYAKAAAAGLAAALGGPWRGVELLVAATLPASAGLSSSSALVVLAALALLAAAGREVPALSLASLLAEAERYVGTQGGGMDQAASLLGERGHALRIDFRPLRASPLPWFPDHVIVVSDSLVRASKAESAGYNTRAAECRLAAAVLARAAGTRAGDEAPLLADLAPSAPREELLAALPAGALGLAEAAAALGASEAETTRLVLRGGAPPERGLQPLRRARHVLGEAARVEEACRALRAGDAAAFGALMDASHASCRDDFEISRDELERLVGLAKAHGALGSRLTGAGFGGCVISLVPRGLVRAFVAALMNGYYSGRDSGILEGAVFAAEAAEGAGRLR